MQSLFAIVNFKTVWHSCRLHRPSACKCVRAQHITEMIKKNKRTQHLVARFKGIINLVLKSVQYCSNAAKERVKIGKLHMNKQHCSNCIYEHMFQPIWSLSAFNGYMDVGSLNNIHHLMLLCKGISIQGMRSHLYALLRSTPTTLWLICRVHQISQLIALKAGRLTMLPSQL